MREQVTSMQQPEWLLELLEEPLSDHDESADRCQSDDRSAVLTDLQRAALRWISSFE